MQASGQRLGSVEENPTPSRWPGKVLGIALGSQIWERNCPGHAASSSHCSPEQRAGNQGSAPVESGVVGLQERMESWWKGREGKKREKRGKEKKRIKKERKKIQEKGKDKRERQGKEGKRKERKRKR